LISLSYTADFGVFYRDSKGDADAANDLPARRDPSFIAVEGF
jgi:hypothetical protein